MRTRVLVLALAVAAIAGAVTALAEGKGDERGKGGSGTAAAAQGPVAGAAKGGSLPRHKGPLYRIVGCASRGTSAYSHGPRVREVAIAFDDGPARLTPAFVAMLERERVRATFFMVGREISDSDRGMLLRELADGDALGDHTFNHANLTISHRARGELAATIARIARLSGYAPCVFRPPYGALDRRVLRVARALGLATVMWNVDPRDWSRPGSHAIKTRILAQVKPGSILISHDGGGPRGQTLNAYPGVIHALRRRGYRFVTVPELLRFRPVYRECVKLCDGLGIPRRALPANAVVQAAP